MVDAVETRKHDRRLESRSLLGSQANDDRRFGGRVSSRGVVVIASGSASNGVLSYEGILGSIPIAVNTAGCWNRSVLERKIDGVDRNYQ